MIEEETLKPQIKKKSTENRILLYNLLQCAQAFFLSCSFWLDSKN